MLVLRRKVEEAIVLNEVVFIRVLAVEGCTVKLGITAPPDVIIVREELLDEAHNSTTSATQPVAKAPIIDYENNCFCCGLRGCDCVGLADKETNKCPRHCTCNDPFCMRYGGRDIAVIAN